MREARLELACRFGRHPLKMVCLPISPLAQGTTSMFESKACEPGWDRTNGPLLKRQMLYHLATGSLKLESDCHNPSLRAQVFVANSISR